MAFTVSDLHDLIRLLEEHPEWRDEVRRVVLSSDLLSLPDVVRELAEAQRRTEARVEELAEAQRRTEARVDQLAAQVEQLAAQVSELTATVRTLSVRVEELAHHMQGVDTRLNQMRGDLLERRYADHAAGYFGTLMRRAHAIPHDALEDLLEADLEAGIVSEQDAQDVRRADVIVRGRVRHEDGSWQERLLVVEVSSQIEPHDVARAERRARHLGHVRPTQPVVAGEHIKDETQLLAARLGVWVVLDGRKDDPLQVIDPHGSE